MRVQISHVYKVHMIAQNRKVKTKQQEKNIQDHNQAIYVWIVYRSVIKYRKEFSFRIYIRADRTKYCTRIFVACNIQSDTF